MTGFLPVADPWFAIDLVDPGILRITEPHCDRLMRANAYLVMGRTRNLLVDSGMGIGALRAELTPWLDKPLLLVATHAHADHIGGHREFRDCESLIHAAEAADLRRPPVPRGLGFDHFEPALLADLEAMGYRTDGLLVDAVPRAGYDPALYVCEGTSPSRTIGEGEVIDLGDRHFEVIHLPGHSPGGLGLWEAASGVLLSGDTLYDGLLLDTITGADIPAFRGSLRRLREMPVRLVLGGHRDPMERERMVEVIDIYLDYRRSAAG